MSDVLLSLPVAFVVYLGLAGLLSWLGRIMAGEAKATPGKASTYASGEAAPGQIAAPGYRPFFAVALFFAILHLGVLILATGEPSPIQVLYLAGLMLALVALILG